ncbi:protein phosphatase 2C [Plasmodium cynomolgi strain B]|uniref:Protein phosphatase 2C n=1 Tax=Plasmodium cynomolgi (strain B) TaxID=1120755 RepID=K6US51_PLACD|nr:protein phosphatase 2C [Plasmodium cynomolgi strain B]GAB64765.1 protein phosphatase 2C [Plasmodium cynomolgi strain B]
MNKPYDKTVKDNPIYVYGKIHDLVEELNRYHQKCYINNEKNVDLWKEFKYKKKKRFQFLSVLDYYANVRNKKWEFDIIPIVFNEEYEILHLGVSMLFNDSFSEEYKKGRYNYIELFICNFEKENVNQCQSEWIPSLPLRNGHSTGDIMDCLVKVEDLKIIYKEGESLRKISTEIPRPCNTSESNDEDDDNTEGSVMAAMQDSYRMERKVGKKQTGFPLGEDFSSQDEQFPVYSIRNDFIGEAKSHLSIGGDEVDAHLLLARNVNVIQDNDMSTLRSNLSGDSGSSVRNRFIASNDKEGLFPTGYYYKKDEENIWKGGSSNREDSSTDGGGAIKARVGKDREGAYPFSHLGSGVEFHSRETERTNDDANQAGIHKVAYYENVKRVNELEEKTYISSEGGSTKKVINYEYLYSRSESETMYLDSLRGRKHPTNEGHSAQGDANELDAAEERPFASRCSVRSGYTKSMHTTVERSEVVLAGSPAGEGNHIGVSNHIGEGNHIGEANHIGVGNHIGEANRSGAVAAPAGRSPPGEFARFTKHEQTTHVNHNEIIQSSDKVHIVESEEYRRHTYTTSESRSSNHIVTDLDGQEGKGSEADKRKEFKIGFFSFKGNRTYNEDRVITIRDVNEFVQKEYKEAIEERGNLLSESLEREYYDMLQKTQSVYRSFGCPSVESAASGVAAGVEEAGTTPPPYMYCAIYDGHNGEKAVNIIQKLLHLHVHTYYINGNGMSNSLKYAFHKMDEHLCRKTINNEEDNHSNFSSGSTACVSVIFNHMMYIANIGDSRCVLSKNGRAVVVTVDHRAGGNKKEEERIITSGGMLDDEGYLGGCLGVCRGFGSFDKRTREKLKGLVCEPDLFQINLTEDDEFLIICCDGIFDVMTSQEAVNTVRASLVESSDPTVAAEALCQLAYKRKALDNLSVVVVIFQSPEMKKKAQSSESASLYAGQAGRNEVFLSEEFDRPVKGVAVQPKRLKYAKREATI